MSIYSSFADRIDADLIERHQNSRNAGIILAENAGGDPLLGIQYACDFRSEEETGAGKMAQSFTCTADPESFHAQEYLLSGDSAKLISEVRQADLVFESDEYIAFSASSYYYDAVSSIEQGLKYVREARRWENSRGVPDYHYKSVTKLRELAKDRGIKGYSKLRHSELVDLHLDFDRAQEQGEKPIYSQPGWFHYGDFLVFEKIEGSIFTEVLLKLVEAARVGQLIVGSGGIGAFGSGFSFFDARDLSDEAKENIHAQNSWYREQMELLKPVAEVVNQGPMRSNWGSAYYFLGRPTLMQGEVKYWLNGSSVSFPNGRNQQPYGYYTLQELLDEKYMEEAAAKSDDDFLRFDERGSYRTTKLTEEQGEAILKEKGLRWASKPMS